ncbi:MAG: ABC transporter permease [Nocardioides sp.]|uniref:ABC transporter permease n=1 Tax=Nocardioides sp. TaxID=35761 RepID=UPI003F05F4F1
MSTLTGAGRLTMTAVRRDRFLFAAWLVVLVGVVYASAAATPGLYPTRAERITAAEAFNAAPAVVALYGPIIDTASLGELAMTKMTVMYAVLAAVFAMVVVRRHLRTEEESGRAELVGGTVVGRGAPLTATVVELTAVALVLGAACAFAAASTGLPLRGSLLFGATWAGTVLVFGAGTALCCQLSASARTCGMIAVALIAGAYVTRMVGDTTDSWVSWLSPLGWNTRLLAWSDSPRWWVLGLYGALTALLLAVTFIVSSRRDLGAGVLAARPGPARGSVHLRDAGALVRRGARGPLWAWGLAVTVLGVVFGSITPGITGILDTPTAIEMVEKLGGAGALEDAMVVAILGVMAVVITCCAVVVLVHTADDEHAGRTELVLATATSRSGLLSAVLLLCLASSAVLLVLTGASMGVGYALAEGDWAAVGELTVAGAVQVPAVWTVIALVALVHQLRSRWTWAGWVLVSTFLLLGEFGDLLEIPEAVQRLSPYAHTPRVPAEAVQWVPLVVMTALAGALCAVAWFVYRRRNIG